MGERRLDTPDGIAERLIRTRLALRPNDSQAAYAKRAGLGSKAYNNNEKGHRIGLDGAIALCEEYNLSLDWIYFGETAGLPQGVVDKIKSYQPGAGPAGRRRPLRKVS